MLTRRQALATLASPAMLNRHYPVIDPHVHVWKHDPRYPWAKETTHPPEKDATPEMLLELMRANGVARTVIIQVIHYRWDNSYAADVLRQYREYFRGVARVNRCGNGYDRGVLRGAVLAVAAEQLDANLLQLL